MRFSRSIVLFFAIAVFANPFRAEAAVYTLVDGRTMDGEAVKFADAGVNFTLNDSKKTYTPTIPWGTLSQESLRELATNPKARDFVAPFITLTVAEKARRDGITPRQIDRVEAIPPDAGIGALFGTGIGLALLAIVYGANIFAASEISRFRRRPMLLVCGVAAVAPIIGPLIFLAMPEHRQVAHQEVVQEEVVEQVEVPPEEYVEVVEEAPAEEISTEPQYPEPVVYPRAQFTMNRRFFESKLAAFCKIVPEPGQEEFVMDVKSLRGNHTARRIAKLEPNSLELLVEAGEGSVNVPIPFIEISEITVRHQNVPSTLT